MSYFGYKNIFEYFDLQMLKILILAKNHQSKIQTLDESFPIFNNIKTISNGHFIQHRLDFFITLVSEEMAIT